MSANVQSVHKIDIDPRRDVIEWPEEVEVLAVKWVRENHIKVTILAPKDMEWHCMAKKSNGEPCRRVVSGPGERCHDHEEK